MLEKQKDHPSQGGLVFVGLENILRKRNVLVSHSLALYYNRR